MLAATAALSSCALTAQDAEPRHRFETEISAPEIEPTVPVVTADVIEIPSGTTTSTQPSPESTTAPEAVGTVPETVVETVPDTTVAPVTEPTSETTAAPAPVETVPPTPEHLIPPEKLVDGAKIGDLSVVRPDGIEIINIPLIYNTNSDNIEPQLERGAVLQHAYSDAVSLGEIGDANVFGHMVSAIHPDYDGDGVSDTNMPARRVFRALDPAPTPQNDPDGEVVPIVIGSTLRITTDTAVITYLLVSQPDGSPVERLVVENNDGSDINEAVEYVYSHNPDGRRLIKLTACYPPGSTRERVIARFEQQTVTSR